MSIEGVFDKISCISTFIVDDEPACAWVGRGEERMRRNAGIGGPIIVIGSILSSWQQYLILNYTRLKIANQENITRDICNVLSMTESRIMHSNM